MEYRVLDVGYIKLIETWGSDERIIEAARMSTDKGFKGWGGKCSECHGTGISMDSVGEITCSTCQGAKILPEGDEKLLRYLYQNNHMTPFEMAGAIFEIEAPIFVFREWHRHRTQSYNELSARYTPLPDVNYIPSIERLMTNSSPNKQAQSTGKKLDLKGAEEFIRVLRFNYAAAQSTYESALAEGVPKELARLVIPVGRYSRMRASANLRNWIQFMTLRCDNNAQWEIRQYADAVQMTLAAKFPRTMYLFRENF